MKKSDKEIAKERIIILFKKAGDVFSEDKKLANKYVDMARKIAMKVNLMIPKEYKRNFCRHCYSYLKPGVNLRVRKRDGVTVYYCLECKKFMRFPHRN